MHMVDYPWKPKSTFESEILFFQKETMYNFLHENESMVINVKLSYSEVRHVLIEHGN